MTWSAWLVALALPLVFALGWFAAHLWRLYLQLKHTRCALCNGQGCYRDKTSDYLNERAQRYGPPSAV